MHARTRETRRRHFPQAQTRDLEEREPALIDLPIPLPVPIASIPILGPILSPLIEGLPWPTPTSATPAQPTTSDVAPTTTPSAEPRPISITPVAPSSVTATVPNPTNTAGASSPSATSGETSSSSGGSSGEVSVGGGSSSSSGSTGSGEGNGSGQGASSGSSDGTGNSGSSASSGGGGAADSASGDSGGGSLQAGGEGGGSTGVASHVSAGADPASAAGSPQSSTGANGAGATLSLPSSSPARTNGQNTAGDASATGYGASATTTGAAMAVANAFSAGTGALTNTYGFVAATTSGAFLSSATTGTAVGASPSGTQAHGSGSSSPDGSDGSSPSSGTTSASSTQHDLSKGAIAAIVVVCSLVCLVVIALVIRRRAVNRRVRRRRNWLFGRRSTVYGNAAVSSSQYFTDHPDNSTRDMAQRNSLGNILHSPWEIFGDRLAQPPPPPPLEVSVPPVGRQMSGLTQPVWTSHLNGSMIFTPSLATLASSSALPTLRSPDRTSWGSAQTFTDDVPSDDGVAYPESAAVSTRSHGLPSSMSVRPFSPTDLWKFPKPPEDKRLSRVSTHAQMASPDSQRDSSDYATAPEHLPGCGTDSDEGAAADPFRDPASEETQTSESVDAETASHFARVEFIRRPFVPALEDEMAVAPGERVRMLQRYPDGWALAENVATRRRGVIPIDCLRTPEQDLPAFLASKRLSSYMKRPPSSLAKVEEAGDPDVGFAI